MTQASPILFCDHCGEHSEEVLQVLQALGHRVVSTSYLRHSLEVLADVGPALLVVEPLARQGLVELQALDRARRVEHRNGAGALPVAFLIVTDEDLPRVAGEDPLPNGPWDVIRRDAPSKEWRLRLDRLETGRTQAVHMLDLAHRASHDDLTGLLRKDAFQARLSEHFSAAQRHHFEMTLVLIDLDDFGLVNKFHYHVVGDLVLQRVGEAIRHALRTEDVAGRLGGDEFAVVLPYTGKAHSAAVVTRLRDAIASLSGRIPGAKSEIRVAASLGFETFNGSDVESLSELRLHTERSLRAAKERGGNQGIYFRSLENAS